MPDIKRFLGRIAGGRDDVMRKVPNSLGTVATTGALLVLIPIIAGTTFAFAVKRALMGEPHAALVAWLAGPMWSMVVFCIDRLLVLGIDKYAPWWKQIGALLIRLPIAVVVGIVISKPVVLSTASTILDLEIRSSLRAAIVAERTANFAIEGVAGKDAAVAQIDSTRERQEARLQGEPDSHEYLSAKATVQVTEGAVASIESRYIALNGRDRAEVSRLKAMPLAQRDDARIAALERNINLRQAELSRARTAAQQARQRRRQAVEDWNRTETDKLNQVAAELDTARRAATAAKTRVSDRNTESESKLASLMRTNLVNQYATMRSIQANPAHKFSRPLRYVEYGLDTLFVTLEVTIVLLKLLSRKGSFDDATQAAEFVDHERVTQEALVLQAHIQAKAGVMAELEREGWNALKRVYMSGLNAQKLTRAEAQQLVDEIRKLWA